MASSKVLVASQSDFNSSNGGRCGAVGFATLSTGRFDGSG